MVQPNCFTQYWNTSIMILNSCYPVPWWDSSNNLMLLQTQVGRAKDYPGTPQPTCLSANLSWCPFTISCPTSLPLLRIVLDTWNWWCSHSKSLLGRWWLANIPLKLLLMAGDRICSLHSVSPFLFSIWMSYIFSQYYSVVFFSKKIEKIDRDT